MIPLYWIRFKTSLFEWVEWFYVLTHYWKNSSFRKVDLSLSWAYFGENYFRTSKRYWQKKKAHDVDIYGETPLSTLDKILRAANIHENDHFVDLGAGRGRSLFFVRQYFGVEATGYEVIPRFVEKAEKIQKKYGINRLKIVPKSYLEADLSKATIVYFYGLFLSDDEVPRLLKVFSTMKPGSRLITVSFPIDEIDAKNLFSLTTVFEADFNWGRTEVYIQTRL